MTEQQPQQPRSVPTWAQQPPQDPHGAAGPQQVPPGAYGPPQGPGGHPGPFPAPFVPPAPRQGKPSQGKVLGILGGVVGALIVVCLLASISEDDGSSSSAAAAPTVTVTPSPVDTPTADEDEQAPADTATPSPVLTGDIFTELVVDMTWSQLKGEDRDNFCMGMQLVGPEKAADMMRESGDGESTQDVDWDRAAELMQQKCEAAY